jgi:hypothetical protein
MRWCCVLFVVLAGSLVMGSAELDTESDQLAAVVEAELGRTYSAKFMARINKLVGEEVTNACGRGRELGEAAGENAAHAVSLAVEKRMGDLLGDGAGRGFSADLKKQVNGFVKKAMSAKCPKSLVKPNARGHPKQQIVAKAAKAAKAFGKTLPVRRRRTKPATCNDDRLDLGDKICKDHTKVRSWENFKGCCPIPHKLPDEPCKKGGRLIDVFRFDKNRMGGTLDLSLVSTPCLSPALSYMPAVTLTLRYADSPAAGSADAWMINTKS